MRSPIGLLGGSFDPIHIGHLQLARDALVQLNLAELRFLPAGRPWQKAQITDAAHRAAMVSLAIRDEARFVLDLHEIERAGPTYTVDTLRALRTGLGNEVALVLILGSDQLQRLDTWRDWPQLLDFAHLAVARRNGASLHLNAPLSQFLDPRRVDRAALRTTATGGLIEFPMTPVDASATEIRALLARPATGARDARLAAILPPAVLDYICAHHLYQ